MAQLITHEVPTLESATLLAGFSGTFDAAGVSTDVITFLAKRTLATEIAMIDPDDVFNFSHNRPETRVDATGSRVIDWPQLAVSAATFSERDLLLVTGDEPNYSWQEISEEIADLAVEANVKQAVALGAVTGMTPHTRDLPVFGYSTSKSLSRMYDLDPPEFEGPTGYLSALSKALEDRRIPTMSIRVEVPHYLPNPPCIKANQALLDYLQHILGISTYADELEARVEAWVARVDSAIATNEDHLAYIQHLEDRFDAEAELDESGDDLVSEIENFLEGLDEE